VAARVDIWLYGAMTTDGPAALFLRFLRFGAMAWGGPAAQIDMIREELVEREGWITRARFNRVLAVYQALPGPEAHELCVYFGMVRGGRLGGFMAGLGFMLPGFVLMLMLAWAYGAFGAAALLPLFAGVAPAVTALIVRALHRIGGHILVKPGLWLVAAAAGLAAALLPGGSDGMVPVAASNGGLLAEGLKAGLLSFGGAYTALPFLKAGTVGVYDGVTPQAFIDGLALASVIPAPLVIFGTFLGYLAGGFPGALLITAGIFAPAFSFTLLGHKYLEHVVENKTLHGVLDAVAAAVVGVLAVTAGQIANQALYTPSSFALFAAALMALYAWRHPLAVPAVIAACFAAGLVVPL
jgi:chromate transporter